MKDAVFLTTKKGGLEMVRFIVMVLLVLITPMKIFAREGEPWVRTNDAVYKSNKKSKYTVHATLNTSPEGDYSPNNSCDDDWAIDFDLSKFSTIPNFDVDRLFIDSTTSASADVLNRMLDVSGADNGKGRVLLPLQWRNWNGRIVSFCAGNRVTRELIGGFPIGPLHENIERDLKDIIVWYDDNNGDSTNTSEISNGVWNFSGNLSWYPSAISCQNATIWRRYDNQQVIANSNTQSVSGSNICSAYNVLPECIESTPSTCGSQGVSTTYFTTGVDAAVVPAPDEGYVDPVVNHKHAIGMHYVKYRMSDQSNWHDGVTTVTQGTNQNLHVRVKVKEKEGWEWNDIYVDLYHSENRWFSRSHDTLVATKRIKELGKKEKESAYFNDIDISNLSIGHHYYFADIRYSRPGLDDHNISSRSDDTEYVVIDVQDSNKLPVGYVDKANCTQISGWAQDSNTTSAVNVHIYDGSTFLSDVYANSYRSDVGNHAFTYAIPTAHKDGTIHTYRVFAINEPNGSNPLLSQGTFSFACGNNGAVPATRFYNSRVDAHFYSTDPIDQIRIPAKYPDWANHDTSFNAFPEAQSGTVPLYTCWTGSTHDYVLDLNQIGQYKPCLEQAYRLFDVYPIGGDDRIPVYLMYKESTDTLILSNGEDDAMYLQNVHGFGFTDDDPLFWAPASLITGTTAINPPNNNASQVPLASSVDEHEQDVVNRVMMILLQ